MISRAACGSTLATSCSSTPAAGLRPTVRPAPAHRAVQNCPAASRSIRAPVWSAKSSSGNIRALFVVGGNPLTALPDAPRPRRALETLDLLVVVDVVETDTTPLATHLWPAAGQLERADLPWLLDSYQPAVATQYTPAVVPAAYARKPVWRIFAELGDILGLAVLPKGLTTETTTDDALLTRLLDGSRGGAEAVMGAPHGIVDSTAIFGWVNANVLPDGRWRIAPRSLIEQLRELTSGHRSLPPASPTPASPVPLALIPQRQLRKMNSQLRDTPAPGGRTDDMTVQLNPDDAAILGIADGASVIVRGATGHTNGQARLTALLTRGAVAIPHGWGGTNVCNLTSADVDVDPLTGMVHQSGIAITVELVGE